MRERKIPYQVDGYHERFYACSGSRYRDKNAVVFDERGNKTVKKVGEVDAYQMIQSFREACDLKKILERCMADGTADQLAMIQRQCFDITGLPADARAAHDLIKDCRFVYEGLSPKQKFLYPTFDDFLQAFSNQHNIAQFVQDSQIETPAAAPIEPAAEEGVSA